MRKTFFLGFDQKKFDFFQKQKKKTKNCLPPREVHKTKFSLSSFTAAAEILAQSSEPFESVVLKFLTNSSERKMGLKTLLDKKLERLTRHEDKIRRDALVMWLLNVQLEELAEMRRLKNSNPDPAFVEKLRDTTDHVQRYFMRKNVIESIQTNRDAVYRMCVAHADFEMQLFFANAVKDLRTVIDILMLREQYFEVLEVLKNQRISELTYEMCPLLIEHIPKQVIVYLIQNQDQISPQKLTPCLSLCVKNMEMAIPAIKYLEAQFKGTQTVRTIVLLRNKISNLTKKSNIKKLV